MNSRQEDNGVPLRNLGGPGGTGPAAPPYGFKHGMRAFRHQNFRVFFVGALASNTGNWLQNLAVPYVLFELTGQALWVGLAGFAQFIPAFLLGPFGGTLADRADRRRVLMGSQFAMAATAFVLWAAWAAGYQRPGLILGLTALTGVFSGIMIPSWQAFVPALVPKEDLSSAITLNSGQFNASRAIGPAMAGVLLSTVGPSWAFFLNGVSFVAVIVALWMVRPDKPEPRPTTNEGIFAGLASAARYIDDRTGIKLSLWCAVVVAFFGNPVSQFTVVFAEDVFHAGPRVFGLLASAVGIGAVALAPVLSTFDTQVERSTVVRWFLPMYAMALIGFGLSPNWVIGFACLVLCGAGFLAVIATTNTSIQLIVADEMRGRVMSARIMSFTLAFPVGSLLQGAAADRWTPEATVVAAGGSMLIIAVYMISRPGLLAFLDLTDDRPDIQ